MTDHSIESSWATEPSFYVAPSPPQMTPKPYQLAGVEYALARDHCLLGDEMGLGKSAQAILVGNAIAAGRTLVVCPASLRLNWEREIWMWSTIENVLTYPVLKAKDGVSTQAHYVIVSYDLLRNPGILGAIMDLRWDHLILDEAHALKDVKGNARTKVICAPDLIPSVVGRITMASGTIMPNQPVECLGAETLVLTDSGWKTIISVALRDRVFDGVEWVSHEGLTYRGIKDTTKVNGVRMTPDHKILCGSRWDTADRFRWPGPAHACAVENLPYWAVKAANDIEFPAPPGWDFKEDEWCQYAYQAWLDLDCDAPELQPVYDLVNAGPRQRFTILSDSGPLIVHNCYNSIRLLNWDAIDRASLQDFRENYYALGGGMVRRPVYDPKIGAMVSKLHWSEEVRNVPTNLADLQFRMRKNIMVRRLKQDVLKDLPTAQWRPFPLVMTAGIKTALAHPGWKMAEKLYDMDALDTGVPIDGQIATARRLLGEAKAPAVAEYIEEMLREGATKLLVSAWHSSVLEILKKRLQKHGLAYMDGATSAGARQRAVDSFQQNPEIKIILGQMQVIGTGWTLTAAQDCVLAEPDWVPGNNDQMLARIHRIGQAGAYVTGHVPVVPGTLDERILGTAVGKSRNIFVDLDKRGDS